MYSLGQQPILIENFQTLALMVAVERQGLMITNLPQSCT
jgi:hypothetical protein